jgi:tetratricopeptide (TPR) repeat protein
MTRQQVMAVMRTFTAALGVRCEHCHAPDPNATAGGEGRGGPQLDHSLDDKETKKVAREMLRMVMDINQKYLPATGRTFTAASQVSCETCHHGLAKPRTLRAALAEAVAAKGADSAIALYKELRTRYYGAAAYDFSENSLVVASAELGAANQRPAAIALLRLNLENHPQSGGTYNALTQQYLAMGDTTQAVAALTKLVELQPQNQQAAALLQRIRRP